MADEPAIFTPFTPGPPTAPEGSPAPAAAVEKVSRKRRAAATVPAAEAPIVQAFKGEANPAAAQPRRRRASAKVRTPAGMKLPISVMLSAMSELKSDDGALLEKLLGILNGAGKGQRERVLLALAKIFS